MNEKGLYDDWLELDDGQETAQTAQTADSVFDDFKSHFYNIGFKSKVFDDEYQERKREEGLTLTTEEEGITLTVHKSAETVKSDNCMPETYSVKSVKFSVKSLQDWFDLGFKVGSEIGSKSQKEFQFSSSYIEKLYQDHKNEKLYQDHKNC